MPFKDPEKRRAYMAAYCVGYHHKRKERKSETTCSSCTKPRDDPKFKKCTACRQYMQDYKKEHRGKNKVEGGCIVADCPRLALPPFRMCPECRDKYRIQSAKPAVRKKHKDWLRALKPVVMAAYGGRCLCCGEDREPLLSIDHIDGYKDGPRGGSQLYAWLKTNNYPTGFRVLCMTCNFTLGHHGYCPHGTLTQIRRLKHGFEGGKRATHSREYNRSLRLETFEAYGGAYCACCGEAHIECLAIDHVDGGGAKHRKENRGTKSLCLWLKRNGFPPGFRVLCHGCNFAQYCYGFCPHEYTNALNTEATQVQ